MAECEEINMGIISWIKNRIKSRSVIERNEEYQNVTLEELLNREGRENGNERDEQAVIDVAESNAEQISIMKLKLKESETEYSEVTQYLTDIEMIEAFAPDMKAAVQDCARQIINLNKERDTFKKKERNISESQYRYIEQYEDAIPEQIEKLTEQEKYRELILHDLKQLEGERGAIMYEKEYAEDKREFLRKLATGGCVLIISLFMFIFLIQGKTKADLNLPFFLLGIFAVGLAAYCAFENRNMITVIKNADKKTNKLIVLTNKIKVKYVNTESTLEYLYEKYRVESAADLSRQWSEYVKIKDEEEMYKKNSELLEFCNNDLVTNFRAVGIKFPEVWIYQPEALLDSRDMVEVRHRLNTRRQKLREQMDKVSRQIEQCNVEIAALRKRYPVYDDSIENVLVKYGVIRGRA